MKRTITIFLTIAGAALLLGGCCRLNGLDAVPSYCCGSSPAALPAPSTSYMRQGIVEGRSGWYDQNRIFHEGEPPAGTAGNRGYFDAHNAWHTL